MKIPLWMIGKILSTFEDSLKTLRWYLRHVVEKDGELLIENQ
jgi:hypothetical protein